jgi:ketosteroid isomerase-like protein
MKRMILVAAMALAACTQQKAPAGDGNLPSVQASDATIDKGERAWAALAIKGDPQVLQGLLADDYAGVTESGEVRNKAQEIAYWKQQPSDFASAGEPKMTYRHFGNTVLAQGQQTLRPKGGAMPMKVVWTDVWMFRDGKWQAVGSQDSVVPAKVGDDMG